MILDIHLISVSHRCISNMTYKATFSRCFGESWWDKTTCANEVVLSVTLLCLSIVFILKIWSLGPYTDSDSIRRLFNLETFVEMVVRTLAISCLGVQHNGYILKFCASFGIFFAFIGNPIVHYSELSPIL